MRFNDMFTGNDTVRTHLCEEAMGAGVADVGTGGGSGGGYIDNGVWDLGANPGSIGAAPSMSFGNAMAAASPLAAAAAAVVLDGSPTAAALGVGVGVMSSWDAVAQAMAHAQAGVASQMAIGGPQAFGQSIGMFGATSDPANHSGGGGDGSAGGAYMHGAYIPVFAGQT